MTETDAILAEFARDLEACRIRYAGRPWDELTHLWLIALERERIVTVAYRRDIVEHRLRRMPLPEPVRLSVGRAIRWAWRDEERHALWIRGALLRRGRRRERLRAWRTSVEGAVAGWASSRQHHHRWSEAPVRRALAEAVEIGGVLAGRIPPAVRRELRWQPFNAFCRFNAAAETTAAMGWARMAELGRGLCDEEDVRAFLAMEQDERRHAALFELLAGSLDDHDRLVPGLAPEALVEQIGAIGQRFLARPRADHRAWDNPLGKGAPVHIVHGRPGDGGEAALGRLLSDTHLASRMQAARRAWKRPPRVAVKAAFMMAVVDRCPAVSPRLLRALVQWLTERGAEVTVLESGNLYDRYLQGRGVHQVADWLGIGDLPLLDTQADQVPHGYARGLGQDTLCRTWRDADIRVAFGKLRGHPTTVAMLGLEALEGLGGRHDAYLFGDRKADRETALLMTMDAAPPDLTLVDAWDEVPDGLLGMLGSPSPRAPLRLYASADAVALDAVLARHLGAEPTDERMLVSVAMDWFGDPRERAQVQGPDLPIPGWRSPDRDLRTKALSHLALPVYQHASRRGALFVPPTADFPPKSAPSPAYRLMQRAVRWLTDDRSHDGPEPLLAVETLVIRGRRVRIARQGQGPAVVLLHGYPETLQIWSRLAPLLTDHEVVALDWPGLGASEPWPDGHGPRALADQLLEILDALDLQRPLLVGQDMGGPPALCLAAHHPGRVRGVMVLCSLLYGDSPTSPEIAVMRRAGLAGAAFRLAPEVIYRRCLQTFLPPDTELPEALHLDFRQALRRPSVRRRLGAMCAAYERALPGLPALYAQVEVPVHALWTADDHHFPPEHGARLIRAVPQGLLTMLPDGGHWPSWTRAQAVADALVRWEHALAKAPAPQRLPSAEAS